MEQKKEEMQPQTRAYTVEEIAAILHIGRSSAYTLVRKGYFKSVRICPLPAKIDRKKVKKTE